MSKEDAVDPRLQARVQQVLKRIERVLADWPRDEVLQLTGQMAAFELERERAALDALLEPRTGLSSYVRQPVGPPQGGCPPHGEEPRA